MDASSTLSNGATAWLYTEGSEENGRVERKMVVVVKGSTYSLVFHLAKFAFTVVSAMFQRVQP